MADLELHPFAAQIEWKVEPALQAAEWEVLFKRYFDELAQKSAAQGSTVIGHIKGYAELPGCGYIQVSAVSSKRAAEARMHEGSGGRCSRLLLTLNLLVYGLPYEKAERIAEEAAVDVLAKSGGYVVIRNKV